MPISSDFNHAMSNSRTALRQTLMLAKISSTSTAGTTAAGAMNSEMPATVSAENPNPAKPLTTPAPSEASRPTAVRLFQSSLNSTPAVQTGQPPTLGSRPSENQGTNAISSQAITKPTRYIMAKRISLA